MLISLKVKNLALIDRAEVEFGEGLNIFSGETGAGKSLVIGAVALCLGSKMPRDMIRRDAPEADIELVFQADRAFGEEIEKLYDIPADESGLVIIRRRISGSRSIFKINDSTVTQSTVRAIAGGLIDIHGQHEHQSLLYPARQREILDRYTGEEAEELLKKCSEYYVNYKEALSELEELNPDEGARQREADLLLFEQKEIAEAALREGEDEALEARFRKMNNSRRIMESASAASELLSGEGASASDAVGRSLKLLRDVSAIDPESGSLLEELSEIDSLLGDFRKDLSDYLAELEFSEEEYRETSERLDLINRLKSKYGGGIPEILAFAKECEAKLERLANFDETLKRLEGKRDEALSGLLEASERLSLLRARSGKELEERLTENLSELNFTGARFNIHLEQRREAPKEHGFDEISFLISTNPGEPLKPLAQVVSGGELSRIMLAVKTVLAESDSIDTLIFDEIDEGISGRTAQKVSEKLSGLSRRHQVILITHLPQIAAMADRHFLIEKEAVDGRTATSLTPLSGEEITAELSRLLGGAEITETVMENAREMKALADKIKRQKEIGGKD
ncbi:MAG: DNA repair protein RecN [Lachnospiraceae bacterium]|nr:DNA repair protein RecN [Lachnospiraceae bacterium]